ncbi:MAG: hypothetical protein ACRYFX_18955 [Janthinobacterium lividum]
MLATTLTYTAATNTVALTTTGPVYPAYQVVDRRPGVVDMVLPSSTGGNATNWNPPKDDCYQLVVQGGTRVGNVFTVLDSSSVLVHLQVADHLEAKAACFDKLARRSPAGHPLSEVQYMEARILEARYALAESNPGEASLILTQAVFPR